jgi:signal transduction histidine kinase
MHLSSLPSVTLPPRDAPGPLLTHGPTASVELAPALNDAAASAELTRYLTEDHDRIAHGLNDVVVRRIFAAGLDLQAALGLIGDHRGASKIWHAVGELDQAVRDIRHTIFDCHPATRVAGAA